MKMKRLLYTAGGVAATLALAACILVLTFDIDRHKARIEAAASAATGMKVSVIGGIKLKLFPRASLSLEDLFVQNRGMAVASVRMTVARIELLPLLRGEVRAREAVFIAPKVFVTRDEAGRLNFAKPEKHPSGKKTSTLPLHLERFFVTNGYFLYRDLAANRKIEANECNLTVRNPAAAGGQPQGPLSLEGEFSCREAGTEEVRVSDVRAVLKAGGGIFEANPVTMKVLGGDGAGSVRRVVDDAQDEYTVDLAVTGLRFEELLGAFHRKKNISGELTLASRLTMQGGNAEELTRTARGKVSLRGQNLLLENLDVDRLLAKADKSQHFNLVDVGAFLVAGPLGTLLTKGYDFGSVFEEIPGAKSTIRTLVSDWRVSGGVAEAEDAAFTTSKNRFALKGKLDFVRRRFEDLSVAVLDAKGCAVASQKIHGDFKNPKIDKPIPPYSVLGPILSLLKKPFEMFKGGECTVYYRGSVEQP